MTMRQVIAACVIGSVAFGAGLAIAAQPRMEEALKQTERAREQLDKAEHDKGGHREKAIQLLDQAIREIREGIKVGAS
jgi:hypothetical protein